MSASLPFAHPSFWHRTALDGLEVDVAILGAGICGVAAACELRDIAPEASLVLIDRWGVAGGASGRNAGFFIAGCADNHAAAVREFGRAEAAAYRAFTAESIERMIEWIARFHVPCDFKRSGSYVIATSPEEDADLRESEAILREDGFADVRRVPQAPFGRGFLGALHNPADAEVHPAKLLRGLVHARTLRVEPTEVFGLHPLGGSAFRVETDEGAVRCRRLLVCANAYLAQLFPPLASWVRPVRGQAMVTAPLAPPRLMEGVAYCNRGYDYFRQLPDGRVLMGGCRDRHVDAEVGYDLAPTEPLQRDLEAFLARHFERLEGVAIEHRWSGTMGFSATGLPIIAEGPEGCFLAAGFTGHGMSYGTLAGIRLARLAWRGEASHDFPPPPQPPALVPQNQTARALPRADTPRGERGGSDGT